MVIVTKRILFVLIVPSFPCKISSDIDLNYRDLTPTRAVDAAAPFLLVSDVTVTVSRSMSDISKSVWTYYQHHKKFWHGWKFTFFVQPI